MGRFAPSSRRRGPSAVLQAWIRVQAEVADVCQYAAEDIDLPDDVIRQRLPAAQRQVSHAVADEEGQRFLARFDVTTRTGMDAACVRSVASGLYSAWLEAVLATEHLCLSSVAFLTATRHRLGLVMPLRTAASACDCGDEDAASPVHAHTCNAIKGLRSSRHGQRVHAWRRVLQRAGYVLCREPR